MLYVPELLGNSLYHLGTIILRDDSRDFGQFATKRHPSVLHHWWIGLGMMLYAKAGEFARECEQKYKRQGLIAESEQI